MISRFGKTFARRGVIIYQISSFSIGRCAASTWKQRKSDAERDADKNTAREKSFKPRSLNTPMTFKQWKFHGPRLYEKRLRFLMKAGNVSFVINGVLTLVDVCMECPQNALSLQGPADV